MRGLLQCVCMSLLTSFDECWPSRAQPSFPCGTYFPSTLQTDKTREISAVQHDCFHDQKLALQNNYCPATSTLTLALLAQLA